MRTMKQLVILGAVIASSGLFWAQAGCSKQSLQQPGSGAPTEEVRTGAEAAGTGAANRPAAEPFQIVIDAPAGKAGQEVVTSIKVLPRGEYKINLEYPHKLQVSGPAGATPRATSLALKDARVSKGELVFRPACTLGAAGEHAFAGTLRFSVCTEKQCEIKAEKIKWAVKVTPP